MADISKITPPGSQTTYNLKDATAREQANWNINNGVKNLAPYNNGTENAPLKIPCNFKNGESYIVSWSSITSTSTSDSSRIAFMSGDNTVSNVYYVSHGVAGSTTLTLTADCDSLWVYAGSTYESNKTVTVSNLMVRPTSIVDSTYEPYALPNTKITPELIELVDSGAKNICNWHDYTLTSTTHRGVSFTNNNDGTVTVNTDSQGSTADDAYANLLTIYTGLPFGLKVGDTIVFASSSDNVHMILVPYLTDHYGTSERGSKSSPCIYTISQGTTGLVVRLTVRNSGTVVNNEKVSAFICSKAAWDVSQKFVPYRPSYEETVEQVAENKNNISSLQQTIGDINSVLEEVL